MSLDRETVRSPLFLVAFYSCNRMLARCLLVGLLVTTCLGALRGEPPPHDNKDAGDPATFPSCTAHAECKPAAAHPNDPESTKVGPTFCAEVTGISGGRCHPCSECHQGARATTATAVRSPPTPPSATDALPFPCLLPRRSSSPSPAPLTYRQTTTPSTRSARPCATPSRSPAPA